jgi:Nidogen-like
MVFIGQYMKRQINLIALLIAALILGWIVVAPAGATQEVIPPAGSPDNNETEKEPSGGYDTWHQPGSARSIAPQLLVQTDRFGYQLEPDLPLAWVDLTASGTEVFVDGDRDDNTTPAISLGFDFPFYEYRYNKLFIGTNGIITFQEGSDSFANQLLPLDVLPNNLIAAFWDDLEISSGKVFYKQVGNSFVVEWNKVVRYSSTDPMTFEVILYKNGDILIQFKEVNGIITSATVGIEDGDGVDGLTYLFNSPGLTAGKAVRFKRPPAAPRVKVLPLYQSGFTIRRAVTFEASVRNTNQVGEDVYDLEAESSEPGWQVRLFAADGSTPLGDTDGDGLVDTGPMKSGTTKKIVLEVTAPGTSQIGDYTLIDLQATSSDDPAKSALMRLQAAVPSDFAQGYADSQTGLFMNLIWKEAVYVSKTGSFFTGNTLSLTDIGENGYFFAWERNGQTTTSQGTSYFSDIEYILLDERGGEKQSITKLTNNGDLATPTLLVNARYPALAHAPNGRIGVVWSQSQLDLNTAEARSDIYFAVIDSSGELSYGPEVVTQAGLQASTAGSAPSFNSPRIAATTDNRFLLSWLDIRLAGAGETSAVYTAVYSTGGGLVQAPKALATSAPGATLYMDPALAELSGERAVLAYSIYDQNAKTYSVAYTILKSSGSKLRDIQTIPTSSGWRTDAIQLENGNILLAWTNPQSGQVARTVLNNNGSGTILPPTDLPLVGARVPDYVSLATTRNGNAILTWMDAEWKDYLYYTLVDPTGEEITPPMIFKTGQADNPLIQTSFSGQGTADFEGKFENFVPTALLNR